MTVLAHEDSAMNRWRHFKSSGASGPGRRGVAGVGLIEVLVAITILAFGLLGIAALQATSLRVTQSSMEHGEAAIKTYEILERMRANYDVAGNGGYDLAAMTCSVETATTRVQKDWKAWVESLQAALGPAACGQIVACGSESCTITVQWNDSRATGNAAELEKQQLTTVTRL